LTSFVVLASLLAGACSRNEPPAPAPSAQAPAPEHAEESAHSLPAGIDWFHGDVDAAFAAAKSESKPLFLYWGAEWCPPCAQIKATIFNRREFQERSRLFIPVYLDGDTPSAQKQGERFGVIGYPTMILFRPDGTEITRLPGGVDVERYATILDVALADARPVAEIVAAAASGAELTPNDWRLLAYYSWGTDNGRVLAPDAAAGTLLTLSERCPADLRPECTRLFFEYLAAVDRESMDGLERASARKRLLDLLDEPAVQRANVDMLLYGPRFAVPLLSDENSPERSELAVAWNSALDSLLAAQAAGASLSDQEQLNLLRARVALQKLEAPGAPLPEPLLADIRDSVAAVDRRSTDAQARQTAINAAAHLLSEAGLVEEANQLLLAELEKSKSPYYFMLSLADLAQENGKEEEAVRWLAQAYAGAEGPATRFQWGYSYLVGLLEMTPEDTAAIEQTGLQVIGELGQSPDAFYQRTRMRLEDLNGRLLEWSKDNPARTEVVAKLRARTMDICHGLPEGEDSRRNCERFLSPAAPATRDA
jgi:thioredoxin-related protein